VIGGQPEPALDIGRDVELTDRAIREIEAVLQAWGSVDAAAGTVVGVHEIGASSVFGLPW
jgi:hypothetical protein